MQLPDQFRTEIAGHPLVDNGGIHVAVAQDHFAARQGRPNDVPHVLYAIRQVKQQFRMRIEAAMGGIQQNRPHLASESRTARLTRDRTCRPAGFER